MNSLEVNSALGGDMEEHGRKAIKEKFKSESSCSSRENSGSRKRQKLNNGKKETTPSKPKKPLELETDPEILQRRQKQIDYGKNTVGYHNYVTAVPINQRKKEDPMTPDKYAKYSRRSWDQLIKLWRKKLHAYDDSKNGGDATQDTDSDESSSNK